MPRKDFSRIATLPAFPADAVIRELREETGLEARRVEQFHTYSHPDRDPRHHTVSVVFLVDAEGVPQAGDDAARAVFHPPERLPEVVAFDHRRILEDVHREFGLKSRLVAPLLGRYVRFMMARESRRLRHGWTYEPPTYCETNQTVAAGGTGSHRLRRSHTATK